jgi:hypothetical protein
MSSNALPALTHSRRPIVYEVRYDVDARHDAAELDGWLLGRAREMLALPGFQDATVYRPVERRPDVTRTSRVVAYSVRGGRELASYLRTHAERMAQRERPPGHLGTSERMLGASNYTAPGGMAVCYDMQQISEGLPLCANCRRPVAGRFCANCGQEDRTYVTSVFDLAGELADAALSYDAKVYRTAGPLLVKPGFLTNEYVLGRRHGYVLPVRLYIFVSLIFFFVFFNLMSGVRLDLGDTFTPAAAVGGALTAGQRTEAEQALAEVEAQLGMPPGTLSGTLPPAAVIGETVPADTEAAPGAAETPEGAERLEPPGALAEGIAPPAPEAPQRLEPAERPPAGDGERRSVEILGLGDSALEAHLERSAQAVADNPRAFLQAALRQIPTTMFVFLPIIALVLKTLYLGSRRYYVEHLIFVLHVHSAVFVLLLGWLLLRQLPGAWASFAPALPWLTLAVWLYIPYYVYRAMRTVYAQSRTVTIIKLALLLCAYGAALAVTLVVMLAYTFYQQA